MKTHARVKWMRTLGNLAYMLGVAFLIAAMAVNAAPASRVQAANTTLTCPLPLYDSGHYALQPGQTVTCTINDAIFIGAPTQLRVYMDHPSLGTQVVWGSVSGTTITFTYTGRGDGCETENIRYSDNDGHNKAISGLRGFGYPGACGPSDPTSTPTQAIKTATPTPTTSSQPGPSITPTGTPSGSGGTGTPTPNDPTTPLIPVTGVSLRGSWSTQTIFFNLGIGFLGLGLVLNGLARSRRDLDI